MVVDLLEPLTLGQLQSNPAGLVQMLAADPRPWCVIDEVQKVPALLDVVQSQIDTTTRKFVLTGSSARKLRRDSANLLGGRAFLYKLFPLTHRELGEDFDLEQVLSFGSIARISAFATPREKISFLRA